MRIDTLTDQEIAPCLAEGPLASHASDFTEAANRLGNSPFASYLRAWCVPNLFTNMERLLANGDNPIGGINSTLDRLTQFLNEARHSGFEMIESNGRPAKADPVPNSSDVRQVTGDHYGNLFREFSDRSYWDEPVDLLRQRLTRNGIMIEDVQESSVLDSGCGGGRYSVAWRLLGAGPVVGVDTSSMNISDARRRVELAKLEGISFEEGNVLDLPIEQDRFDIVFSNGVLHHTTDWEKGLSELLRVLKPGGWGWLYLIENPGGIFWDVIEILRVVMKNEEKAVSRTALQMLNMPANRIFYMLDHVMVPINLRLTADEVKRGLSAAGAVDIRRLDRGADIDRIECIHRKDPWARERFGAGENRYVFSKPHSSR